MTGSAEGDRHIGEGLRAAGRHPNAVDVGFRVGPLALREILSEAAR